MQITPSTEYLPVSKTTPLTLVLCRTGQANPAWGITGLPTFDPQKKVRVAVFKSATAHVPKTFLLDDRNDAPAIKVGDCVLEVDLTEGVKLHAGYNHINFPENAILLDGKKRILVVYFGDEERRGEPRGLDLDTGNIEPLLTDNYFAIATRFRIGSADMAERWVIEVKG